MRRLQKERASQVVERTGAVAVPLWISTVTDGSISWWHVTRSSIFSTLRHRAVTRRANGKGIAVFCGPRGLPSDTNVLYRNTGGGYFQDVTSAARIDRTSGRYCFSVSALDFDNDGWPDIYVACDSRLHFGLGPNTKIDYVEAHWPSGLVERFASPAIDRILVMKEGLGEAVSQSPRQGTPKH